MGKEHKRTLIGLIVASVAHGSSTTDLYWGY